MLHLPILRRGRPYTSVEVATIPDFRTKKPFAGLSQANAGLVRRDLLEERQAEMRAALDAFTDPPSEGDDPTLAQRRADGLARLIDPTSGKLLVTLWAGDSGWLALTPDAAWGCHCGKIGSAAWAAGRSYPAQPPSQVLVVSYGASGGSLRFS